MIKIFKLLSEQNWGGVSLKQNSIFHNVIITVIEKEESETISASEATDLYADFCSPKTTRPLS